MSSESTSSQSHQVLTPSFKVKFQHHECTIAYNNVVALLEHHDPRYHPMLSFLSNCSICTALTKELSTMYTEYLKDFWYTAEVDDATKDISFSLSLFENQLTFTRFYFLSAIGLTDSKTCMPLPPKGTGSHDQMNLSQQTIACCLIFGLEINIREIIFNDLIQKLQNGKKNRETNISATSFQTPSASKPLSQPKAPTTRKPRKEKIPSSSQPKVLQPSRNISTSSPPTTHLQHAEEFVVITDATKSLDASEPAEVLDQIVEEKEIAKEHPLVIPSDGVLESPYDTESEIKFIKSFKAYTISDYVVSSSELSSMPDDDLYSTSPFNIVKYGDEDDDIDMVDSKHISKEGTTDTFLNASTEFHSLSRHLDHVCEEVSNLYTKIADMKSLILQSVSDEIKNSVPSLISNALRDQLPGLLSEALKECLTSILHDSLPTQLHQTVVKPMKKQFNIYHKAESERFVTLQTQLTKVLKFEMRNSVSSNIRFGMQEVSNDLKTQSKSLRRLCLDVQGMQTQLIDIQGLLESAVIIDDTAEGEKNKKDKDANPAAT
ncbi:hypothetical protein Tco_0273773 [Tanacetum coccineum]